MICFFFFFTTTTTKNSLPSPPTRRLHNRSVTDHSATDWSHFGPCLRLFLALLQILSHRRLARHFLSLDHLPAFLLFCFLCRPLLDLDNRGSILTRNWTRVQWVSFEFRIRHPFVLFLLFLLPHPHDSTHSSFSNIASSFLQPSPPQSSFLALIPPSTAAVVLVVTSDAAARKVAPHSAPPESDIKNTLRQILSADSHSTCTRIQTDWHQTKKFVFKLMTFRILFSHCATSKTHKPLTRPSVRRCPNFGPSSCSSVSNLTKFPTQVEFSTVKTVFNRNSIDFRPSIECPNCFHQLPNFSSTLTGFCSAGFLHGAGVWLVALANAFFGAFLSFSYQSFVCSPLFRRWTAERVAVSAIPQNRLTRLSAPSFSTHTHGQSVSCIYVARRCRPVLRRCCQAFCNNLFLPPFRFIHHFLVAGYGRTHNVCNLNSRAINLTHTKFHFSCSSFFRSLNFFLNKFRRPFVVVIVRSPIMSEASNSMLVAIGIGFIKSLVCVYDLITYPIYTAVQRPWEVRQQGRVTRARHTVPDDPRSGMFDHVSFFLHVLCVNELFH